MPFLAVASSPGLLIERRIGNRINRSAANADMPEEKVFLLIAARDDAPVVAAKAG
ncbi:hypothetical protein [Marinimicrococcus flavescens]|uniref:Uncharacterized protein n=1 Tax=Marinimicrococcus flavescens TaxID=3031815 RepID=A0AAP3V1R7_9PROT|nr:hypothetical protein [Marinimicrococcus flavescens]